MLRHNHRPALIVAGVSLAVLALAGCRDHDGRIHTGSIKDTYTAAPAAAPASSPAPVRKAAPVADVKKAEPKVAVASPPRPAPPSAAAPAPAPAQKTALPAPPAAAAPAAPVDRGPVETALEDSRLLMTAGDVLAARARLEKEMVKARSPYLLAYARLYDPNYVGRLPKNNASPDADRAAALYKEAAQLGSVDAGKDLQKLQGAARAKR